MIDKKINKMYDDKYFELYDEIENDMYDDEEFELYFKD